MRIKHTYQHGLNTQPLHSLDSLPQPLLTLTMRRPIAYCAGRMINPPDRFIKILRKSEAIPAWKEPHLRSSHTL